MTPQQEAEYLQDMKSFRVEFIENLARELIQTLGKEVPTFAEYTTRHPKIIKTISKKLNEKLPSAFECAYQVDSDQ